MSNEFRVGQFVTWTSQSQGSTTTKSGIIVSVVPEDARPDKEQFPALHRQGCGYGRKGESYVVSVGGKLYWPRASSLKIVEG